MTVPAPSTLGGISFEHYRSRFPITALAPWRPSVGTWSGPPSAADDIVVAEISTLLEIVTTMFVGDSLRRGLVDRASDIARHDEISDTLADAWTKEVRELGEDANLMRSLAAEAREAVEEAELAAEQGGAHAQSSVLVVFRQATEQADDIADLMEDVAETQALAAHRPFRERVKRELEAAGAA